MNRILIFTGLRLFVLNAAPFDCGVRCFAVLCVWLRRSDDRSPRLAAGVAGVWAADLAAMRVARGPGVCEGEGG